MNEMNVVERGNVLVIGNSGVGKSTLINAALGKDCKKYAPTGWGITGTTKALKIYESNEIPFRVIDTIGFEPSMVKAMQAVHAVKKWSKNAAKKGQEDNQINVIWFCVDGTSSKLFPDAIKNFSRATAMWEDVPVIVVITKSYSRKERDMNIAMVNNAFARQKKYSKNVKAVLPVVAQTYELNDDNRVTPEGIEKLIDTTNDLMPEGIRAAKQSIDRFKLQYKRRIAQGVAGGSVLSAVAVGATPIPCADFMILGALEVGEFYALAATYGIHRDEKLKELKDLCVTAGTVGAAAKGILSTAKAIPGINLATGVLNAVVAGIIVAGLGEAEIYLFEQIYLGKKDVSDLKWAEDFLNKKFSELTGGHIEEIVKRVSGSTDPKDIAKIITGIFEKAK